MSENVIKIDYNGKEIYLVKTAHVSKDSIEDVRQTIEEINPDSICIELDEGRYQRLKNPDDYRETNIIDVIKKKEVGMMLVNTILASFQRRMAKSLGSNSGGEMMEAIRLSEENNINLVLADRSIKTTFSRIWNELDSKEKFKLLEAIIESIFTDEEITEEDLAKLKEADALEAALSEVSEQFPTVKRVLVDERDQYLTEKIRTAPGEKVVAIIGAAHSLGIQKYIDTPIDTDKLDEVKKHKSVWTYVRYAIPALLILLTVITIINNKDAGFAQIKSWILWNGCLSAFGVILAHGHLLSVLTALVMAPVTSLNPLLASGWFAGIVEATIRKPKIKDFEDLAEDTATFKGFFKNQFTRILLVVVFANIFSTIGTIISGIDIVRRFIEAL